MVTLETVEIPGLREAVQRESRVRDTAFLEGNELLCGVMVRPLCLDVLIWLEHAKNGYCVPCTFYSESEKMAHALQLLYFSRPGFRPPTEPVVSFWRSFCDGWAEQMFIRKVIRGTPRGRILHNVSEWLSDALMDAPSGGSDEVKPPSYASYPVYIVDLFAEAGFTFTYREIMEMPLRRLWQHMRIANRRLKHTTLTNPSDQIAVDYIASQHGGNA